MRPKSKKYRISLSQKLSKKYKTLSPNQIQELIELSKTLLDVDFELEGESFQKYKIIQSALALVFENSEIEIVDT